MTSTSSLLIKTLILEETNRILLEMFLGEAMFQTLPEDHVLWIEGSQHRLYLTIRAANRKNLGMLIMRRIETPIGAVWEMDDVEASKGYGPLLYDVAIELASNKKYFGDLGLMPDRTSVSKGAERVWKYYYENRNDVQHKPVTNINTKIKNLPDNREDWLRQYYFKNNSPAIDKLLELGQIKTEDYNFFS